MTTKTKTYDILDVYERIEVIGLYGSGERVFRLDDRGEARELLQAVCAQLRAYGALLGGLFMAMETDISTAELKELNAVGEALRHHVARSIGLPTVMGGTPKNRELAQQLEDRTNATKRSTKKKAS